MIDAVLDHVAVAVPRDGRAEARWRDRLGAGSVSHGDNGVFAARQLRYANGAKLELLSPPPPTTRPATSSGGSWSASAARSTT